MGKQTVIVGSGMLENHIDVVYAIMGCLFVFGILLGFIIGLHMYEKLIAERF